MCIRDRTWMRSSPAARSCMIDQESSLLPSSTITTSSSSGTCAFRISSTIVCKVRRSLYTGTNTLSLVNVESLMSTRPYLLRLTTLSVDVPSTEQRHCQRQQEQRGDRGQRPGDVEVLEPDLAGQEQREDGKSQHRHLDDALDT